jgi:hypothetical protein
MSADLLDSRPATTFRHDSVAEAARRVNVRPAEWRWSLGLQSGRSSLVAVLACGENGRVVEARSPIETTRML